MTGSALLKAIDKSIPGTYTGKISYSRIEQAALTP